MNNIKTRILIVDDDPSFCEAKSKRLKDNGFEVQTATDPKKALKIFDTETFDLVITDLRMESLSGIELLAKIKDISPDTEVIVITGFASIETAIEAIKAGAYDYIAKTAPFQELLFKIQKALEKKKYQYEINQLRNVLKERFSFQNIIGKNEKMQSIYQLIETVKDTEIHILIRGETGTGKELVAKAMHFNSCRKNEPFIVLNCAAISETLIESELFGHDKGAFTGAIKDKPGKLELANGGTIFLDEIGDMSVKLQAKLLRVLQDKKFERVGGTKMLSTDARIISATNRDLEKLMQNGGFREDLFYRIDVVNIKIPPLRERLDDLKLLVNHFIDKFNKDFEKNTKGFSNKAMDLILTYNWPGNVRELENLIGKLIITAKGNTISKQEVEAILPGLSKTKLTQGKGLADLNWENMTEATEKEYLETLLTKYKGRLKSVSQKAEINRRTLYKKMKAYKLRKEDFIP